MTYQFTILADDPQSLHNQKPPTQSASSLVGVWREDWSEV